MKKSPYLCLLIMVLFTFSCQTKEVNEGESVMESETTVDEEVSDIPLGDNSEVSLDWNGTYIGTLPCADCEGIETTLTLHSDRTYVLNTRYLGRNDDLQEERSGSFTWGSNGSIITLSDLEGMPGKYKVGENRIWHLDMNGEMITGDLADHYILSKQ